jgi:pseudouridine-5'-phosphate glycosidase
MAQTFPTWLNVHPDVRQALENQSALVALESTVITHGLPRPLNLDLARRMEAEIASKEVQPATIAALDGDIYVGLTANALERLAVDTQVEKFSRRDLGIARAKKLSGGITVAGSIFIAHSAGIQVFATGGIGGVHRGDTGDISADLPELTRIPVAVVCSGAKSILDLPRTLEWLETAGVPILGWRTNEFPAFFSQSSGLPISARVDSAIEVVAILQAHWEAGLQSGVLICVPCPPDQALPKEQVEEVLEQGEQEAREAGIYGKALTPFLLDRLASLSGGASVQANLALLRNNARVAANLAQALASMD